MTKKVKGIIFLMLAFSITTYAKINGQHIDEFSVNKATLKTCLKQIEKKTGMGFIYNGKEVENIKGISLHLKDVEVTDLLDLLLKDVDYTYRMVDGVIALVKEPAPVLVTTPAPIEQERVKRIVTGTVHGADGLPLAGASVMIKGTFTMVATDVAGHFQINVDDDPKVVLQFSFVGMRSKEVSIGNSNSIRVVLEESDIEIGEIVVLAYGTQIKRNVTGSIAKIDIFAPEKSQGTNVMTGLQGRVPGLWVRRLDGTSGASPEFVIRGYQANNMSNRPLVVLDGMIVDNNDNFNLANITPQDIESIEVLKDAASSAMYGSRGAMGVVMITTKHGQLNRKPTVNVSSYFGIVQSPMDYRMLNNSEYEMVFKEARNNRIGYINNQIAGGGLTDPQIATLQSEVTRLQNEMNALQMGSTYVDWIKELIPSHAFKNDVHVSLNGGDAKTSYYFSVGRNVEENSVGAGRFTRLSTKLAISNQTCDWLKIGANLSLSQSKNANYISSLTALSGANVRPDTPYEPKINEDGTWDYYFGTQRHPLLIMRQNDNENKWTNVIGDFKVDIKLLPNLVWTSTVSGILSNNREQAYNSPQSYNGRYYGGNHDEFGSEGHRITSNSFLNYYLQVSAWDIAATLGYEFNENRIDGFGFAISGFPGIEGLEAPANGSTSSNDNLWRNTRKLDRSESVFMRANVSFKKRYLLSMSMRRDGTSKLPIENRYSNFPAVSAGWIISDEPFMGSQTLFTMLKLRSSYGTTGSIANINMTDTFDVLSSANYFGQPALKVSNNMGNPNLQWEKTNQYDLGLDMGMFANRLSVTAEWYYKHTSGMITSEPLPSTTGGFTSRKINAGVIRNRGLDLAVSFRTHLSRDFSYDIGLNMNINRSKILDLPVDEATFSAGYYGGGNSPRPRMKIGEPFGALQMYQALGIDQNGDVIYFDKDKNGSISATDMVIVSNLQPDFIGGLNLSLNWKGFSLFGQLAFTYGGSIYNCDEHFPRTAALASDGVMRNFASYLLDRWTPENKNSRYPRYIVGAHGPQNETGWNDMHSTLYLFDASFLKLNKLTVSYDLPKKWTSPIKISTGRVYLSGENLLTIKNKALNIPDPEAALNSGIAQKAMPTPRCFMVGIDISI